MKKLISIVLVLMLLLSVVVVPAFAETSENNYLFEDKYIKCYVGDEEYWNYSEEYYHYSENQIDWVLIKGELGQGSLTQTCFLKFDNFVLHSPSLCPPFDMKYAVYDVKKDIFVDLVDDYDDLDSYEGLYDVLKSVGKTMLLGDGDGDGELNILDATRIQMELAGLERIWDCYTDQRGVTGRFSDIDCDGELSILDATGIQLKLAGLE